MSHESSTRLVEDSYKIRIRDLPRYSALHSDLSVHAFPVMLALVEPVAVLRGQWGSQPLCEKSDPLCPPTARSKVNDAAMLINYVVIASNVCM